MLSLMSPITLKVKEFDTFDPRRIKESFEEEEWTIYAKRVKDVMLKASGLLNSESGFRDITELLDQ